MLFMSTGNSPYVARDLAHVWHPCTQMKDHEQLPPTQLESHRNGWRTILSLLEEAVG